MNKILKSIAFAAIAICSLFITQMLSNIFANVVVIRMPEIYYMYGLIRAVGYFVLAGFCFISIMMLFNLSMEECWIKPVRVNRLWIASSFIVCITLVVIYFLAAGRIMINKTVPDLTGYLWVHGITYFVICSTIIEGIILAMGLRIGEQSFGKVGAIFYSTLFFVAIYATNSHLNGLEHLLFIISVILNILVQILIIIESKSVWNSIIFHGIWNFFLASGIIFIGEWHGENAVFTIPFNNGSILLTGGAAGCEASLLSMAALGVMLFIAIGRIRENKSQVPLDIEKMNQNEEEV